MKVSNVALLFISGFTAGALTGLLLAPDEGARTRKKLMKKAKKYKKDLENTVSEYKSKAVDIKDNIEEVVHDVKKRFS
ncbi:MAG TPA: YtxH domain-containing protein [Hanamia sp.]